MKKNVRLLGLVAALGFAVTPARGSEACRLPDEFKGRTADALGKRASAIELEIEDLRSSAGVLSTAVSKKTATILDLLQLKRTKRRLVSLGEEMGALTCGLQSLVAAAERTGTALVGQARSSLVASRPSAEALREAEVTVDKALSEAGLDEPFHAELIAGLITGRPDQEAGDVSKNQASYVRWQSRFFTGQPRHVEDSSFNLKLTGRFGFAPISALIEKAADSKEASTLADTLAFVWDSRLEFHAQQQDYVDIVGFLGAGQTMLTSDVKVNKTADGRGELAVLGGKVYDGNAFAFEGGLALQVYKKSKDARRLGKDPDPRLSVSASFRRDLRLRARNGTAEFDRPEDRLVVRLLLAEIPVAAGGDKPFNIRFGIEHERGWTSRGAPAITRVVIAGDLHIVQALKGGKPEEN